MSGRDLRMLVVNDEEKVPTIPNIELVPCPSAFNPEKEILRIGEWRQHLWMWMTQEIPTFDILLVDIRFHRDTSDPVYFDETKDQAANPLGLLHALPLVGQLTSSRMPFVWGIHSSAKEAVVDDPVATICYGLLCAMDHVNQPDIHLESEFKGRADLSGFIRKKLLTDQSVTNDPGSTVRSLVSKYRKVFNDACRDKLALTHGVIDKMCAMAQNFIDGKGTIEKLLETSISVGNGLMTDQISLRSFFADVNEWTQDTVRLVILPELQKLQTTQNAHDIYPIVLDCIRQLDLTEEDDRLNAAQAISNNVQPNDKDRYSIVCVALILCTCLRLLHDQWRLTNRSDTAPSFPTYKLAEELGYFGKHQMKWPDNRLKTFFGNMRPTTFRDMLVTNFPLHPVLRQCGVKYWEKLNREFKESQVAGKVRATDIVQFDMPDCLFEPAEYEAS